MNKTHILALELSGGVLVGATVGFLVGWKRAEAKFDKLATQEIEEAKKYYGDIHEKQRDYNPEDLVKELQVADEAAEALADTLEDDEKQAYLDNKYGVEEFTEYNKIVKQYSPVPDYDDVEKEPVRIINVFDDSPAIELDKENRNPLKPYIIDKEEFFENEPEHAQSTITYYDGDDVLADERDSPIQDKEKTVGETHLDQFGFASGDDNIIYIRNETLELDFEICKSEGKFTEEVLGFIEHSDRPRGVRKFRGDDE